LAIAIAGMLSLLFLPRAVHLGSPSGSPEQRDLADLRHGLETGDPSTADGRLAEFLARHPSGPMASEARLLFVRTILAQARSGRFPGSAALRRAWTILAEAPRSAETLALRGDVAELFVEYGMTADGVNALREFIRETADPSVALDLVSALVKLAAEEPARRHAHLDEASAILSEVLRTASAERRVDAILAQTRVYRASSRDKEALQLLVSELAETRASAERGRLQLERGRTLQRLSREMEAMVCFDEAEKLFADPWERGLAMVHEAQLFVRASNPEAVEVSNRLTALDSPAASLGLIVAGVYELKSRPPVALDQMANGFARIRRPRVLDEFDYPWVYAALRAAAACESDPELLLRFSAVFSEIGRLKPLSPTVARDHAEILLRARRFDEASERFLAAGDILEAADACAQGGMQLRAASLYRSYVDLQPAAHTDGLFKRALSLKKAGDAEGAAAGFEEYVAKAGPSGKFSGAALLEKAELQKDEDALATYVRVLKARDVATSPVQDDWARALLGRGRTLVRLNRSADARKILEEYLERYAEGPAPKAASLEAASLLVACAVQERDFKQALERTRRLDSIAAKVPEGARAPYAGLLNGARLDEAEFRFQLEDYAAAHRLYLEAARLSSAGEERLRALIGAGRSLARMGRRDDARRELVNAKAILDRQDFVGPRRDYWNLALSEFEGDLR
jgi:TolA-binding protein